MPIQNLPVWSFEPNWSDSVVETFDWLTEIMASPTGAEQRRSLRAFPWASYEFAISAEGSDRQYLDFMIERHGSAKWYLPLFYEAAIADGGIAANEIRITTPDAQGLSWIRAGAIVCITNGRPRSFQLAEVESVSGDYINLTSEVVNEWPAGVAIYPCVVAELTDQPELTMRTANLATAEIRFRLAERPTYWPLRLQQDPSTSALGQLFAGFHVCPLEPDWNEAPKIGYERRQVELSNNRGFPLRQDTAGISFLTRDAQWTLEGRPAHDQFRAMLQYLRGRAMPLWMPSFMDDLTVVQRIVRGTNVLKVDFNGFTSTGGPRLHREHIMIEYADGGRVYRRIIGTSNIGAYQTLTLDADFAASHDVEDVVRVSFMTLMRLNHDSVAIDHQTDTLGVSTVRATFRAAPNLRSALPAFGAT